MKITFFILLLAVLIALVDCPKDSNRPEMISEHPDPSVVGRVEGTKLPMKDCIVPVTLKDVTGEDAGVYQRFWMNSTRTERY